MVGEPTCRDGGPNVSACSTSRPPASRRCSRTSSHTIAHALNPEPSRGTPISTTCLPSRIEYVVGEPSSREGGPATRPATACSSALKHRTFFANFSAPLSTLRVLSPLRRQNPSEPIPIFSLRRADDAQALKVVHVRLRRTLLLDNRCCSRMGITLHSA